MKQFLIFLLIGFSVAACSTAKMGGQTFGEEITSNKAMPYKKLIKKMDGQEKMEAKVVGDVSAVCQKKGCWINMTTNEPGQPEMFVKFKDYGFFLPKDIAGRKVVLDGYAFWEVTEVDELKHMAEDEGKSKEEIAAITAPKEELKFMASGVLLLPQ